MRQNCLLGPDRDEVLSKKRTLFPLKKKKKERENNGRLNDSVEPRIAHHKICLEHIWITLN